MEINSTSVCASENYFVSVFGCATKDWCVECDVHSTHVNTSVKTRIHNVTESL